MVYDILIKKMDDYPNWLNCDWEIYYAKEVDVDLSNVFYCYDIFIYFISNTENVILLLYYN